MGQILLVGFREASVTINQQQAVERVHLDSSPLRGAPGEAYGTRGNDSGKKHP